MKTKNFIKNSIDYLLSTLRSQMFWLRTGIGIVLFGVFCITYINLIWINLLFSLDIVNPTLGQPDSIGSFWFKYVVGVGIPVVVLMPWNRVWISFILPAANYLVYLMKQSGIWYTRSKLWIIQTFSNAEDVYAYLWKSSPWALIYIIYFVVLVAKAMGLLSTFPWEPALDVMPSVIKWMLPYIFDYIMVLLGAILLRSLLWLIFGRMVRDFITKILTSLNSGLLSLSVVRFGVAVLISMTIVGMIHVESYKPALGSVSSTLSNHRPSLRLIIHDLQEETLTLQADFALMTIAADAYPGFIDNNDSLLIQNGKYEGVYNHDQRPVEDGGIENGSVLVRVVNTIDPFFFPFDRYKVYFRFDPHNSKISLISLSDISVSSDSPKFVPSHVRSESLVPSDWGIYDIPAGNVGNNFSDYSFMVSRAPYYLILVGSILLILLLFLWAVWTSKKQQDLLALAVGVFTALVGLNGFIPVRTNKVEFLHLVILAYLIMFLMSFLLKTMTLQNKSLTRE